MRPYTYKQAWYNDFVKKKNDLDYEMEEIGDDNPSKRLFRKRANFLAIKS